MGREVMVGRGDQKIFVEIWHPDASDVDAAPRRAPLVIMAHGFGGSHRWAYDYAPAFEDMGFVVLSMDFCGGAVGSRSTGVTTEMSIMTELADLEAVLDWAREQPDIDASRVILMGQSLGAAVCAMLADKRPQDIRAMILCYPAFSIHEDMIRRFGDKSELPETFTMWMPLGRRFAQDAMAYDFYEHMGAFEGHVLIIHGTDDSVVPLGYSERATGAFSHARLEVIEGGRHGFVGRACRRTVMLACAFLTANA